MNAGRGAFPTSREAVEQVVLLSEEGSPIGTAAKDQVHHLETPLHLAFSCYVFDPQGRLLVTRRAWSKRTWPGVWTNSCCGHPAPGESAADDGVVENEVCPVYVGTCLDPKSLSPDPSEVSEHAWVDWLEFREDVRSGQRDVSPWCRLQLAELAQDL